MQVQHTQCEFPCTGVLADGGDKHVRCYCLAAAFVQLGFQLFDFFLNLLLFLIISHGHPGEAVIRQLAGNIY